MFITNSYNRETKPLKMVAIEGIDSVGKQTIIEPLIKALCLELAITPNKVRRVSFPRYGTSYEGQLARHVLSTGQHRSNNTLLNTACAQDRVNFMEVNYDKYLSEGVELIVADRSYLTNVMYTGSVLRSYFMFNEDERLDTVVKYATFPQSELYAMSLINLIQDCVDTEVRPSVMDDHPFSRFDVVYLALDETERMKRSVARGAADVGEEDLLYTRGAHEVILDLTRLDTVREFINNTQITQDRFSNFLHFIDLATNHKPSDDDNRGVSVCVGVDENVRRIMSSLKDRDFFKP